MKNWLPALPTLGSHQGNVGLSLDLPPFPSALALLPSPFSKLPAMYSMCHPVAQTARPVSGGSVQGADEPEDVFLPESALTVLAGLHPRHTGMSRRESSECVIDKAVPERIKTERG